MMILVLNGPNLNFLGRRDRNLYGKLTLKQINKALLKQVQNLPVKLVFYQSNHEGFLIEIIQKYCAQASAIIINPAALTHYSYSLADALADTKLPIIEVHLSDLSIREKFRQVDVLSGISFARFSGKKEKSYYEALDFTLKLLLNKKPQS